MPQGFFLVDKNPDISWDVKCELHSDFAKEELPQEQKSLYLDVELVNNIVNELQYTDDLRKLEYSKKLLSLAQAGLVGENAQPKLAIASLERLKEEILTREGSRIKNTYMKILGKNAFIMGIIALSIGTILSNFSLLSKYNIYFFVWTGAMAGTWVSFGARKVNLSFENLSIIEKDRLSPQIRLIFIGISSLFLILFLKSGIMSFTFGNLNFESINKNIEMQFLVGAISGLLEHKLANDLFSKASGLLNRSAEKLSFK